MLIVKGLLERTFQAGILFGMWLDFLGLKKKLFILYFEIAMLNIR